MRSRLHDLNWIREKTAARWDKLMQSGQLAEKDLERLRAHSGASDKAGIQRALQSFVSPLNQQQLARHETFHKKVTPHVERAYGVKRPSEDPLGFSSDMYVHKGQIYASPASLQQDERYFGALPPSSYRSSLEHEAAEARMDTGRSVGYKTRPFGTHYGPAALIAERLGFQNPDVHALLDLTREANPYFPDAGNSDMLKKLKRHGMVGNYVMPLGGRAHRSADFDRRDRRRLQGAPEKEELLWLKSLEKAQSDYRSSLTPAEREKGLQSTADRAPGFRDDPAHIAEIQRIAHHYFYNENNRARKDIRELQRTDPKVFLATQAGSGVGNAVTQKAVNHVAQQVAQQAGGFMPQVTQFLTQLAQKFNVSDPGTLRNLYESFKSRLSAATAWGSDAMQGLANRFQQAAPQGAPP